MKTITEKEILAAKKRANGYSNAKDKTLLEIPEGGLAITPEQTKKGLDWLMDQWKTPRGIERKNNPFGYREQEVLENFSHFLLTDWYDAMSSYGVQQGYHSYLPVYTVVAKDGSTFEYHMAGGEINITG